MKKMIEELNESKLPIVIVNKRLEKYDNLPLFQKKLDEANALLAEFPPTAFLRKNENKRIKRLLEQGMSIEQIVERVDLSEDEVKIRLQELDF
jgi:pantothenate kinase-related protein Tda10